MKNFKFLKVTAIIVALLAMLLIGYRWGVRTIDRQLMETYQRMMDQFIADRAAETILSLDEMKIGAQNSLLLQCQMKKLVELRALDWRKCTKYEACKSEVSYYSKADEIIESFQKIDCP